MNSFSFDLVDRPWIPCSDLGGDHLTFGIRELFERAHEIRSIEHQNPLAEAALLRVLLAVIHRAIDGPRKSQEWKTLYQAGRFDNRIPAYLKKWRHRFDLFSSVAPFYQTPGLLVVDSYGKPVPQGISSIMLERANGNTKTLFDHTGGNNPVSLSPAEAALVLITAQMFSLPGLNRKTTNLFGYQQSFLSASMVSGIFITLNSKSLFETLMLNLLVYSDIKPMPSTKDDCPVWERTDIGGTAAVTPKGYLDFLTCKCRHILLVPHQENGEVVVNDIHIAQGEAFPEVDNPGFISKRKKDGSWYHPQLDVDRLVWRDSTSLFAFDGETDRRPQVFPHVSAMGSVVSLARRYVCQAFALANDKANPLAWSREKLNVPLSLLSDKNVAAYLIRAIALSDGGAKALGSAAWLFMRGYLPPNSKDVREKVTSAGTTRTYWDRMEGYFHQFLSELEDPDRALERWESAVKRAARVSLDVTLASRYREAARSYRAWQAASAYLNAQLAELNH